MPCAGDLRGVAHVAGAGDAVVGSRRLGHKAFVWDDQTRSLFFHDHVPPPVNVLFLHVFLFVFLQTWPDTKDGPFRSIRGMLSYS